MCPAVPGELRPRPRCYGRCFCKRLWAVATHRLIWPFWRLCKRAAAAVTLELPRPQWTPPRAARGALWTMRFAARQGARRNSCWHGDVRLRLLWCLRSQCAHTRTRLASATAPHQPQMQAMAPPAPQLLSPPHNTCNTIALSPPRLRLPRPARSHSTLGTTAASHDSNAGSCQHVAKPLPAAAGPSGAAGCRCGSCAAGSRTARCRRRHCRPTGNMGMGMGMTVHSRCRRCWVLWQQAGQQLSQ